MTASLIFSSRSVGYAHGADKAEWTRQDFVFRGQSPRYEIYFSDDLSLFVLSLAAFSQLRRRAAEIFAKCLGKA